MRKTLALSKASISIYQFYRKMFTIRIKLFTDSSDNGKYGNIINTINFVQHKKQSWDAEEVEKANFPSSVK